MEVFVEAPSMAARVARTLSTDGAAGSAVGEKENAIRKPFKGKGKAANTRPRQYIFGSVSAGVPASSSATSSSGSSSATTAESTYDSHLRKLQVQGAPPFVFDEREMCPKLVGREICPPPGMRSARSPPCMVGVGFKRGAAHLDHDTGGGAGAGAAASHAGGLAGARLVRPRAVRRLPVSFAAAAPAPVRVPLQSLQH